ncbi:hypothetical protein CHUAL_003453 [Chamberlinius hualienensis]
MKGDPCQKEACAIQKCLQVHNYVESECSKELDKMLQCCKVWNDQSGCCSGFMKEVKRPPSSSASEVEERPKK